MYKNKVVLVDYGLYLHKAIFLWEMNLHNNRKNGVKDAPVAATWSCMNMIIADLSKLDLEPSDLIIVAIDGKGNWRKEIDPNYKANRKGLRDSHRDIDWKYWFKQFDNVVENLEISTPFVPIRIDMLEADDIIACAVRYFKDKKCVIVSSDSDFEQLACYKNVELWSPTTKKIKTVSNPYDSLEKKIKKEVTDNLLTPILNKSDYDKRRKIVSLIDLPKDVEHKVKIELDKIIKKEYNYNISKFVFPSLRQKISNIYTRCKEERKQKHDKEHKRQCRKIKVDESQAETLI